MLPCLLIKRAAPAANSDLLNVFHKNFWFVKRLYFLLLLLVFFFVFPTHILKWERIWKTSCAPLNDLLDRLTNVIDDFSSFRALMKSEDADNLPRHVGDSIDCALLQFVLEMGETYQIWRDEYPEETLVYRSLSPKGVPFTEEFALVVIQHHGAASTCRYTLYCRGAASYLLPLCTNMAFTRRGSKPFADSDRLNIIRQMSDLEKRKPSIEVVCLTSKCISSLPGESKD